jgi:uncharacterized protein
LESLNNSSALAAETSVTSDNAAQEQIFVTRFMRIIPIAAYVELVLDGNGNIVAKLAAGNHKVRIAA